MWRSLSIGGADAYITSTLVLGKAFAALQFKAWQFTRGTDVQWMQNKAACQQFTHLEQYYMHDIRSTCKKVAERQRFFSVQTSWSFRKFFPIGVVIALYQCHADRNVNASGRVFALWAPGHCSLFISWRLSPVSHSQPCALLFSPVFHCPSV